MEYLLTYCRDAAKQQRGVPGISKESINVSVRCTGDEDLESTGK